MQQQALLNPEKLQELQKAAPESDETTDIKTPPVNAAEIPHKATAKPQIASLAPKEINDLIAWANQPSERQQPDPVPVKPTWALQPPQLQLESRAPAVAIIELSSPARLIEPEPVIQLPDTTKLKLAPADIVLPAGLEPAPIEAAQKQDEVAVVDILGINYSTEDLAPQSIALEPAEEYLPVDNDYLETNLFEEAEDAEKESVDLLIAELEEGMQLVEAEYVGELLVSILADFVEVEFDAVGDPENPIDIQIFQAMAIEAAADVLENPETAMPQDFETEFSLYLESLEPTQVEAAKDIVDALAVAIKETQQLAETTDEEGEIIEQQAEELCVRLFECLGIEYDEETITRFIQNVKALESVINIDMSELADEDPNTMGTHEFKPLGIASLLGGLTRFIKQKARPYLALGRYTLQVCAA